MEHWKPLSAFPGYSVSDEGRVRNDKTGLVLKCSTNASGYHAVSLPTAKGFRVFVVHRLVAQSFLPPGRADQTEVAHNDNVRTNNRIANLRWATRTENQRDRHKFKTDCRGERSAGALFTNAQAAAIRAELARTGMNNCAMGRRLGCSHETIRALRQRETYQEAA